MSRVFVPLAREPFEKFESGLKWVEVRNQDSPVAAQVRKADNGDPVLLRLGYSGPRELNRALGRQWAGPLAEMPEWAVRGAALGPGPTNRYFDRDGFLLCFEALGIKGGEGR